MANKPEPVISQNSPPHVDGFEWWPFCARCGGDTEWEPCGECDDGYIDEYEDDPINFAPGEELRPCSMCLGRGGRNWCGNSWDWCLANPLEGRQQTSRGELEWRAFAEGDYA